MEGSFSVVLMDRWAGPKMIPCPRLVISPSAPFRDADFWRPFISCIKTKKKRMFANKYSFVVLNLLSVVVVIFFYSYNEGAG